MTDFNNKYIKHCQLETIKQKINELGTLINEVKELEYYQARQLGDCLEQAINWDILGDIIEKVLYNKQNQGKLAYYIVNREDIENQAREKLTDEEFDEFIACWGDDVYNETGKILIENNNFKK